MKNDRWLVNLKECWRKRSWPNFKVLSRHLPGGTEEIHRKLQPGYPVSWPIFEPGTSRIRSRSVNHSIDSVRCDSRNWKVQSLYSIWSTECNFLFGKDGRSVNLITRVLVPTIKQISTVVCTRKMPGTNPTLGLAISTLAFACYFLPADKFEATFLE
jgi:hypothetical protein